MNLKRLSAFIGVILIAALFILALIFALMDHPLAPNFLIAALFCTMVVPGIIYGFQLIVKMVRERKEK